MQNSKLPEFIDHLLLPDSYPHPAGDIELVQTHISFVILAGRYVYKWKKTVDFGFVDFSSLAKRKYFCEQELHLNRRLCPEIYLEVTWISREGGSFSLQGKGEIVEYGVKMVRMPEEGMMSRIIVAGGVREEHLDTIVGILVPFYRQADGGERVRANGRAEAVGRIVFDNFAQTERFVGGRELSAERFAAIKEFAQGFLRQEELFAERIASGCIRDCHGDLYSGNICLADKIHIFDCIEFNERLRFIDMAADVAFLAMDLDFHGCSALSDYFISRFIRESGDEGLRKVLNFYKCYRAYVRGKVSLLTASDPSLEGKRAEAWLETAGRYFQLAEEYTRR
ncbi:MAG: hypothetical protein VR65_17705 [Desulfobulbaceae bacterium BRH_c16a]|nr:MAG: hypothetical protein VR65_17705 [Desulfobulbaceae bacterium BRH_c16a]